MCGYFPEKSSYVRILPREVSIVFSGMRTCAILSVIVLTALRFRERRKEVTFIVKGLQTIRLPPHTEQGIIFEATSRQQADSSRQCSLRESTTAPSTNAMSEAWLQCQFVDCEAHGRLFSVLGLSGRVYSHSWITRGGLCNLFSAFGLYGGSLSHFWIIWAIFPAPLIPSWITRALLLPFWDSVGVFLCITYFGVPWIFLWSVPRGIFLSHPIIRQHASKFIHRLAIPVRPADVALRGSSTMAASSRLLYATSIIFLLCATSSIVTWTFLIAGRRFSKITLLRHKQKLLIFQEIIGILLLLGAIAVLVVVACSPPSEQGMRDWGSPIVFRISY